MLKVIVIDSHHLPRDADFPPLDLYKYGWEQYVDLDRQGMIDQAFRMEVVVSVATEIDAAMLTEMQRVRLLVVGDRDKVTFPKELAAERGIVVCDTGDKTLSAGAEPFCSEVVAVIEAFLAEKTIHQIM
ncbi:MAG: hypothetical protein Q9N68_06055 [Gammaproteobacteria bacterium]|nr:hypothetical protein [Gammaproteobacteria bacterium]